MNDNKWITDRLPTRDDCTIGDTVWVWDRRMVYTADSDKEVLLSEYYNVDPGTPWQPIIAPEPYVEPKRFVAIYFEHSETWCVIDRHSAEPGLPNRFNSRETAERIAEIFNEVNE